MTASRTPPLGAEEAYKRLEGFTQHYGRRPLLLLIHAAVPQSLRPDLLNLIKVNFVPEAGDDLSVDADVLLSPLAESVGAGYHRLDAEIRHQCLLLLDAQYRDRAERRRVAVARFLLAYVNDLERRPQSADDPLLVEYLATEREVASAFIDPQGTAARLANALTAPSQGTGSVRLQLTGMAAALSLPLAGFPGLVQYARGIGALRSGDQEEARRQLEPLRDTAVKVGDVALPPASEALRTAQKAVAEPSPEVAQMPRGREKKPRPPSEQRSPRLAPERRLAAFAPGAERTGAYVPGFKHDIFISYAIIDDEPDAQKVRWVTHFRRDLEIALRQRLGRDIRIFFDSADLHAYQHLEQIIDHAGSSAIFLALLSPSYVERKWSLDELKAFAAASAAGARAPGEPNRIVTIEIFPVEERKLPPEVQNLKRLRFYERHQETRAELKLTPDSNPRAYNERVHQLAHDLAQLLRDLRNRRTMDQPAIAARAPSAGKTVMLAQVTDDLYDQRQQVQSYLEDLGVTVIPKGEYAEAGAKFAAAVKADIERADLFVQLLSQMRSLKPDDLRASESEPATSYAQFQYDAALRRGIPVLQWRHPTTRPEALPRQNWDRELLAGPDVRVMGLHEFQKEIRLVLDRLSRPPRPTDRGSVFILADSVDQDLADMLTKVFKEKGRTAFQPLFRGSAREIERDLEDNLIFCSALLLIYGRASLAWVRAHLRRIARLASQREKEGREPLRPLVLLAPPPPKGQIGGSGDFDVIDCVEGLDGAAISSIQAMIEDQNR